MLLKYKYIFVQLLSFCTIVVTYNCTDGKYGSGCETCGYCNNGANCDKISGRCELGCKLGYRMPLCKSPCVSGTYGKDCAEQCGHCYQNEVCNIKNGVCPSGRCDTWYVGNNSLCNVFISKINIYTIPRAVYVQSDWARLDLDVSLDIGAIPHYQFAVHYINEHELNSQFMKYKDISSQYDPYIEKLTVTIHKLKVNTQYWFRIQIYREHDGLSEAGNPSKEVKVATLAAHDRLSEAGHSSKEAKVTHDAELVQLHGVIVLIVFQQLTLLIISGIALWLVYQCYRQRQGGSTSMKLKNDVSANNFHQSHSEADTSRVAFRL